MSTPTTPSPTLAVGVTPMETRHDIACVLINPLQSLHPNAGAASDGSLVASDRKAGLDRAAYAAWLGQIREVCTRRGIVLIMDEVFTGFRLAYGGAQEYFGVTPDLTTLAKGLGGGFPVAAVGGTTEGMRHVADGDYEMVGTFNGNPLAMAATRAMLHEVATPDAYRRIEAAINQANQGATG